MTALEVVSLIFSTLAFGIAAFSLIEIKAMQRSTHQVQFYNPAAGEFDKTPFAPTTQAEKDSLTKDIFDNI